MLIMNTSVDRVRSMLLDKLLDRLTVQVEPFALCLVSSGWRLCLPCPSAVTFHFVLQGRGYLRGPGKDDVLALSTNWLAVVPSGLMHSLESKRRVSREQQIGAPPPDSPPVLKLVAGKSSTAEFIIACGLVSVRYGQWLGLFDHLKDVLAVDLSDSPRVRAAFRAILSEQSDPSPGGNAMTTALMTTCLVELLRHLAKGHADAPPWLTALEDRRLGRAIDRILADVAAHHTVESLADAAAMSRSAFAEKFTETFGRPPMSLVHYIRMQRADRLLREGELPIEQVAQRVGFSSRSHFSRVFKEHYGISPAAQRAA